MNKIKKDLSLKEELINKDQRSINRDILLNERQ